MTDRKRHHDSGTLVFLTQHDTMIRNTPILVDVAQANRSKGLPRAHTQFHNLIRKIDRQKQLLAVWSETLPRYRSKVAKDYQPLQQTYQTHRADLVRLFDEATGLPAFKKRDREKLAHLILDLAGELIGEYGFTDLKPIYDRHAETDFDTEAATDAARTAELMQSILGIDFDPHEDISSPEKLAQAAALKLQRAHEEAEERRQREQERRATRPKTARQLEKEAIKQAAERETGKSIQDVYRKLVTAMHPDREPDPAERERKTALMQQVNAAYQKKDLLELLELQLALEQIDPAHLAGLTEERIKHYNKILREQSEQLAEELAEIENEVRMQAGLGPFQKIAPGELLDILDRDIGRLKRDIRTIRKDLESLRDHAALKTWLKEFRIPRRQASDDALLDLMFSDFKF